MANKGNDLPPKVYRQMLKDNYQENREDANQIKVSFKAKHDPICQKEDRYIPPKTKANIRTEEYERRMAEKPEKAHIKRIPIQSNLSSGVTVVTEQKKSEGIKINPYYRRNQISSNTYEKFSKVNTKFRNPDNLKNFFYDDFNSKKENQNDRAEMRKFVRIFLLLFFSYIIQKRYENRPLDNDILGESAKPVDNYSYTYSNGFHRPVEEKTYDRIFNEEKKLKAFNQEQAKRSEKPRNDKCYKDNIGGIFQSLGNNTKTYEVTAKPCN